MSDGDEDDEIDELREQTRGTDRISADAGNGTEDGEKHRKDEREQLTQESQKVGVDTEGRSSEPPIPPEGFEGAFEERANRTDSGIDPRTVSATDPALSALLLALQDAGELDDVGGAIADELGAPAPPEYDRDAVVRLAVAYALKDVAPEYFEELASARRRAGYGVRT
jgi:hypothetical protein